MQSIKNTNNYLMNIIVLYMNYKNNFLIILVKKIYGHQLRNKWVVYSKSILRVLIKIQLLVKMNFHLKIIKSKMKVMIFRSIFNIQIIHLMYFWIQDLQVI